MRGRGPSRVAAAELTAPITDIIADCHYSQPMAWNARQLGSDRPYLDGEIKAELVLREKLPYWNNSGYCYLFADKAEHCIVWFSKRKHPDLDVGTKIQARFVIKTHRLYNGVLENITKKFTYTSGCE